MNISFVKSAEKELLRLDKKLAKKIVSKIKLLADDPYGQNSKKLTGSTAHRIRWGDYRIIYEINKSKKEITIFKIGHRREIYK